MDAYAKLLEEIEGHVYSVGPSGGILRCQHLMHNNGPSANCWRASVSEFLDAQSCKRYLEFLEDGEIVTVRCAKPVHDKSILHEGDTPCTDIPGTMMRAFRTIAWKEQ